jgi:hypothetical protein
MSLPGNCSPRGDNKMISSRTVKCSYRPRQFTPLKRGASMVSPMLPATRLTSSCSPIQLATPNKTKALMHTTSNSGRLLHLTPLRMGDGTTMLQKTRGLWFKQTPQERKWRGNSIALCLPSMESFTGRSYRREVPTRGSRRRIPKKN